MDCHDAGSKKSDVVLEGLDAANPVAKAEVWERVVRKLGYRQMPPIGEPRPDNAAYDNVIAALIAPLDRAAAENRIRGGQIRFGD